MIRRKITEDFTLRLYKKRFDALSKQTIDFAYLQQSDVYGFFLQGKLVAGFVIRTEPEFYHLSLLDQANISTHGITVQQESFCEIAGLWIAPHINKSMFRTHFYLTCIADALQTGKELILGGSPVRSLVANHQVCLPYTLYQGQIDESQQYWNIYYGTRWSCLKGVALQFPGRVKELIKAQPGDHHPETISQRPFARWHKVTKRLIRR